MHKIWRKKLQMLIKNTYFSSLVTTTVVNTKFWKVENKIPHVGVLVIPVVNTKFWEVENKALYVSGLVKKTDSNPKTSDIEAKYFTTSD